MILQVAYTVTSSLFGEDKDHYPRFYRLVPITEQVVNAYVALVKKLNWKRVLIISYDDEFFTDVSTRISILTIYLLSNRLGCIQPNS